MPAFLTSLASTCAARDGKSISFNAYQNQKSTTHTSAGDVLLPKENMRSCHAESKASPSSPLVTGVPYRKC
eukprot:8919701-Pyramimonas_sp.AAC.2